MRNYQAHDEPIPGYRLQKPLGQGSFGQVWKALGPGDVEVALKIIRGLDGRYAIREWLSLQNVMNLRQPNLVAIYGVWLKDESGKVLKKEEILSLIPPEPAPSTSSSPQRSSPAAPPHKPPPSKPSWSSGERKPSAGVPLNVTLTPPEDPPEQQAIRETELPAKTHGSSAASALGSGSAGSGDLPMPSANSGSAGSGSSGSNALARALNSAKLPPLELVTAMTLGEGTLMDRLKDQVGSPGIPRQELLSYIRDAARGIQFLNQNDIHHCDIKPENLMIVGGSVQVCDYGSALKTIYNQESRTHQGVTREYAAPEQLTGRKVKMHKSTDQYALAMTYYALRTGKYPWRDDANEPIEVIKHSDKYDFSDLAALSPWTFELDVIRRALRKDPKERFPSMTEFMEELDQAVEREAQAVRDRRRKSWRRVTAAASVLVAIGLGVLIWLNLERIKRGWSEPLHTQIASDLEDASPSDDAFLKRALPKLQAAIKNKRDISNEKVPIQGLLAKKLKTKLDHALEAAKGNGDGGKAIDSWLSLVGTIPTEFQSDDLIGHQQLALLSYPLTRAQEGELQKFVDKGRFLEALEWSASQRQSQSLKSQIRERWLAKAKDKNERLDPTGLKDLLECHTAIPRGAAELNTDVTAALKGYLKAADKSLSGNSESWPVAAKLYREVQEFLAQNAQALGDSGVAVALLRNQTVLGELSAELRQKDESQADWQSLNSRLVDPGDESAPLATRFKLLLASFAEKLTPSPATEPISKLPLLDDKVLSALVSLADGAVLSDWESNKFSRLRSRLQTILEENRGQLAGSPTEQKILTINKGAAFLLALLRAEDALRLAKPDLAAAAKSLQEAAEHEGKATAQDINRMRVLQLWHFLVDPSGHATEAGFPQIGPGLELFINSSPSKEFDAGFLDALYAASLGSPQLSQSIASVAASTEEGAVPRRLLVEAQARVAETRRALEGASPDWAKLHNDWLPLIKQQAALESSPQAVASPYRNGLILFYAAFLEASASQTALPTLDEPIRVTFEKVLHHLEPQDAAANDDANTNGPNVVPDREYLRYIRDLALETWPGLKTEGTDDANRFLMEAKSVKLLEAPFRRARAAKSLLAIVNQMDLPQDDQIITTISEQKSQAATRLLEGILSWVDQTDEAVEARAKLGIVLAHGKTTPATWERIRGLTDALAVPEHAEQWRKEKIWGQLLLANAQGHYENRHDDASRRRAVLQFGRLTHWVMNLSQTQEQLSDSNWCQRIWKPCQECMGNPTMESPPDGLAEAYATILGTLGTILERDRSRQVSRDFFDELKSPDLPLKTRRDSFHAASELEKDDSRRARWLVGEGRALRDLSDDDTQALREKLKTLVARAKQSDEKYHGCFELEAHLNLLTSREEAVKASKMKLLGASGTAYGKALELVKAVPFEQERESFRSAYLEQFSQTHLEKAFHTARGPEKVEYLQAAEKAARAALEVPDRLRIRPEGAYVAWGNSLEDLAWHAGCLDYFVESESKFENAVTLANSSLAKAYAKMNLGRVQFRHAFKAKLKPEAHQQLREAAQENLKQALTAQVASKRFSASLQTESFLAQIDHALYSKESPDLRRTRMSQAIECYDRIASAAKEQRPAAWAIYRSGAASAAKDLATDYYYKDPKNPQVASKHDSDALKWAKEVLDSEDSWVTPANRVAMCFVLLDADPEVRRNSAPTASDLSFAAKKRIVEPVLTRLERAEEATNVDARISLLLRAGDFVCSLKENGETRRKWLQQAEELVAQIPADEQRRKQFEITIAGSKGKLKELSGGRLIAAKKDKEGIAEYKAAADLLLDAIAQADKLAAATPQVSCNLDSEPKGEHGFLQMYDSVAATLAFRLQLRDIMEMLVFKGGAYIPVADKRKYLMDAQKALEAIAKQSSPDVDLIRVGAQIGDIAAWLKGL